MEKRCQLEHGQYLDWACANCERGRAESAGPYAMFLLFARRALRGGLAMPPEAWPLMIWADLGAVEDLLDSLREERRSEANGCPLARPSTSS